MPDDNGYPTDEELHEIEHWPAEDFRGWFNIIKAAWWAPDWGWTETPWGDDVKFIDGDVRVHLSTGGWSGNESIISAMRKNQVCWSMTWESTRRGGHYTFECPK